MKNSRKIIMSAFSLIIVGLCACQKEECKKCVQTICGIASCEEYETIESCDQAEIDSLQANHGNVYWTCN